MRFFFPLILVLAGCSGMARSSMTPEETTTVHVITTTMDPKDAFLATEEALATSWNNWKGVNQLRQPETGTLLVKGIFEYGGDFMNPPMHTNVSIRAKVAPGTITMTYLMGNNTATDGGFYPSESGSKEIREQFRQMTVAVAQMVKGATPPEAVAAAPEPKAETATPTGKGR